MANLLNQKVKFLRNALPFGTYTEAHAKIVEKLKSSDLSDGEIVLASYIKTEGTEEKVRTLLGIKRDIQDDEHGHKIGYEIFDNEAANDAIKALDATVGSTEVAEGKHVAVQVVEADGILTKLTVTENDIASAAALTKEISDRQEAIAQEVTDRNTAITNAINGLDTTVSYDATNVNVSITETNGILTGLNVSEDYATVTRTETSSSAGTPVTNAAINVAKGDEGKLIKASDLAKVAAYAADKATEEMHRVDKKIADLDVEKIGNETTYIKSVSETDGKIAATTGILNTDAVAFVRTEGSHTALASATTTTQALDALEDAIEANKAAELTYEVERLTKGEIATLSDANVKEAYKVVSVNKEGTKSQVGATIKIYKDSAIQEIYLGSTEDTIDAKTGTITKQTPVTEDKISLNYAYQKADGTFDMPHIPVSDFLRNSEFKNGLQVINGEVSVKIDAQSEGFLTVSESGVKLSGVQDAITSAINSLDKTETTASVVGAHVTVKYSEENGIVSMNVTESDIASAQGLAQEIADRKAAIEALDYTDNAITNQYVSKVDEVNGKIEVTRTALPVISVASDNSSVNVTNTSGAVNVQVHVDNDSIVVCADTDHKGELTVGTIDCGTY